MKKDLSIPKVKEFLENARKFLCLQPCVESKSRVIASAIKVLGATPPDNADAKAALADLKKDSPGLSLAIRFFEKAKTDKYLLRAKRIGYKNLGRALRAVI